jgi:endonuclease/exonuclease/phosphatase family metal-dependent hydrolase
LTWRASLPAPLGPAQGTTLVGQTRGLSRFSSAENGTVPFATTAATTLRIGTFNIHGCKGADGCRDLGRVADCLRGLDFVALNEVHGPRLWQNLDQAGQLGQRLGMAWLFAPNTRTWYHLDSGNGLLSTLPVAAWQRIPLAQSGGRGYRNAVLATLCCGDCTVRVLATHITRHDGDRQEQLRAVIDLYLALAEPAILLGDLNSAADDPQIRHLLAAPGVADCVGERLAQARNSRIDWIFARGLRPLKAGIQDSDASDHPMVWAELQFPRFECRGVAAQDCKLRIANCRLTRCRPLAFILHPSSRPDE